MTAASSRPMTPIRVARLVVLGLYVVGARWLYGPQPITMLWLDAVIACAVVAVWLSEAGTATTGRRWTNLVISACLGVVVTASLLTVSLGWIGSWIGASRALALAGVIALALAAITWRATEQSVQSLVRNTVIGCVFIPFLSTVVLSHVLARQLAEFIEEPGPQAISEMPDSASEGMFAPRREPWGVSALADEAALQELKFPFEAMESALAAASEGECDAAARHCLATLEGPALGGTPDPEVSAAICVAVVASRCSPGDADLLVAESALDDIVESRIWTQQHLDDARVGRAEECLTGRWSPNRPLRMWNESDGVVARSTRLGCVRWTDRFIVSNLGESVVAGDPSQSLFDAFHRKRAAAKIEVGTAFDRICMIRSAQGAIRLARGAVAATGTDWLASVEVPLDPGTGKALVASCQGSRCCVRSTGIDGEHDESMYLSSGVNTVAVGHDIGVCVDLEVAASAPD